MTLGSSIDREQHCIERALERYGLALSRSDLRGICDVVHSGQGRLICWQDDDRAVFEIEIEGVSVVVVYDGLGRQLRTFLPARENRTDEEYIEDLRQHFDWEDAN